MFSLTLFLDLAVHDTGLDKGDKIFIDGEGSKRGLCRCGCWWQHGNRLLPPSPISPDLLTRSESTKWYWPSVCGELELTVAAERYPRVQKQNWTLAMRSASIWPETSWQFCASVMKWTRFVGGVAYNIIIRSGINLLCGEEMWIYVRGFSKRIETFILSTFHMFGILWWWLNQGRSDGIDIYFTWNFMKRTVQRISAEFPQADSWIDKFCSPHWLDRL